MRRCKNCGELVLWEVTPIDNFWYHANSGLMKCSDGQLAEVDDER